MVITNNERGTMDTLNISIAEGKKNFSKIIRASEEKNQRIIISRSGRRAAIIFPYEEFEKNKKKEALKRITELRLIYRRSGITANEVYEISRNGLQKKI
jgi:prevent-host-death family protein